MLVQQVLAEGAPLFFKGRIPPIRSMRQRPLTPQQLEALQREVSQSAQAGYVEEVSTPPHLISPVFVVPKSTPGKWRVIVDLRFLNRFQRTPKFRYEGVKAVASLLKPRDWTLKIDLKDGFHHIEIRPDHRGFLGFRVGNKFYRYTVLPFGSQSSPYVFTRMLRPVIEELRSEGIRLVAYVDDLLLMAESPELLLQHTSRTMHLLAELGWHINEEKSSLVPTQCTNFLGLTLDTSNEMPVWRVPPPKKSMIRKDARRLMRDALQGPLPARRVAHVVGKLIAISLAVTSTHVLVRNLINCINESMATQTSWTQPTVRLSQPALADLNQLVELLTLWDGRAVVQSPPELTLETDASDSGWGGHIVGQPDSQVAGLWTADQRRLLHINVRELAAVQLVLNRLQSRLEGRSILILSDNAVTVSYLNRMTGRSSQLAAIAREIHSWTLSHRVTIAAAHIPGESNSLADRLSRVNNRDWQVSRTVFDKLQRRYNHQIDWFAEADNARLPVYASRFQEPGACLVNAMAHDWSTRNGYMAPPFAMLPQVVSKICNDRATTTLIAPIWPAQPWYQCLLQHSVEVVVISNCHDSFRAGSSCSLPEPLKNLHWQMAAFRVSFDPTLKNMAIRPRWLQLHQL